MSSLHFGKENTSRNVTAVHFITITLFISRIYKPFLEKVMKTSKTNNTLQFGYEFSFTYFLLEEHNMNCSKYMHTSTLIM